MEIYDPHNKKMNKGRKPICGCCIAVIIFIAASIIAAFTGEFLMKYVVLD